MNKVKFALRIAVISTTILFLCAIFCPIINDGSRVLNGYDILFGSPDYSFSFVLLLAFLCSPIGTCLTFLKKKVKNIELVSIVLLLLGGILLLISPDIASTFCSSKASFSLTGFTIAIAVVSFVDAVILFFILASENEYSVYDIVESAMLIALAIGLDLPGLKIPLGANGGSISFSMVPLFILCLRQGPAKGFIGCGIVYGIITCLMDGWGLYTFPFDYLLGYGAICLVGFFRPLIFGENQDKYNFKGVLFICVGTLIAVVGRLAAATLSGIVLYEMDFVGSLIYNIIYVLPSGAIVLACLLLLYKPLILINRNINSRLNKRTDSDAK